MQALVRMVSRRRSSKDMSFTKDYPPEISAYEMLEYCGRGVTSTVHRALCIIYQEVVAIKKMHLECLTTEQMAEITREAQTMKQYLHPNVLPLYCSFVSGLELWMVMPFISGGSVLHLMHYAHPDGLDEVLIATIMREVLRALEYVHKQGGIHRDIKAGNILIDAAGHVMLADFGVAASMERAGSWGQGGAVARNTFVGTPCWMAPEVMEQQQGYDSSADIWSFGITLIEMAQGKPPFAKYPPMKVLLSVLKNPPPVIEDKKARQYSKAMHDLVAQCLQKDPSQRPSAAQLLEHKFFKQARDDEYIARTLMAGLPSLQERVQAMSPTRPRPGTKPVCALPPWLQMHDDEKQEKKPSSGWNFDVAALKAQAAAMDEAELAQTLQAQKHKDAGAAKQSSAAKGVLLTAPAELSGLPDLSSLKLKGSAVGFDEQELRTSPTIKVGHSDSVCDA